MDAAEAFLQAAGDVGDPREVAVRVKELFEQGRRTHASITVEGATFGRYLAERVARGESTLDAVAKMRADDLFLACACAQGSSRAMTALDWGFLAPAVATLVRMGEPRALVDEAAQAVRERLFLGERRITEFSGRGSLAGWLRVSLARQVVSLKRLRHHTVELDDDTPQELAAIDPELAMMRRRYGEAFRTAFRDAFAHLTAEQRSILALHFIDGLNLERIARILQISRATAGRRVLVAKSGLQDAFLALLVTRLRATRPEIESLLAIVRSTFYTSLAGLLRDPA